MAVIADFNFDDKHSLDYYQITIDNKYLTYKFDENKLIVKKTNNYVFDLLLNFQSDIREGKKVKLTIKGARGEASLRKGFTINNDSEKDVTGEAGFDIDETGKAVIMDIAINKEFSFIGYKIETID